MSSKSSRNHDPRSSGRYDYEDADRGRGRQARSDSRERKGSSPHARKHEREVDAEREWSHERRKRDDMRPPPPTVARRPSRGRSRSVESLRSARHVELSPLRSKRHRHSPSPRHGSHRHKKRHASIPPADKRRRSRSPGHTFTKHKRPKRPRTRSRSPPSNIKHGTRDTSHSPLPAPGSPSRKHKPSGRHRERSASPPRRLAASLAPPPAAYRKRSPPPPRREPPAPAPPPLELSPPPPPPRSRRYPPERGPRIPPSPPPPPARRGSSPRRELSKKKEADYPPPRRRHSQSRSDRSPYRDRPDQPPPPPSSARARSPPAHAAYSPPPMRVRSPPRSARHPRELFPVRDRRQSPPGPSLRSVRTTLDRGPPERRNRGRREDDHGPPEGRTRSRSRESNHGPPRRRTPPRSPKRDAGERPPSRRNDIRESPVAAGDSSSKGQPEGSNNGPYVNPERQRLVLDRPERGSGRGRGRGRGRGGRGGADHHRNQPLTFGGEFPARGRGSARGGRGGGHSETPEQQGQSPPASTQDRMPSDSQRSHGGFTGRGRGRPGQQMSPEVNGDRPIPTGPAADQKPSEMQPPTKPASGDEPVKTFKKVVSDPDNTAPENAPTAPAAEKIKFTMAIPTKPSKPVKPAPKALDMRMGKFATGSNSAPLGGRTIDLTARLSRVRQSEPRPTQNEGPRRGRRRSPPRRARAPSSPPPPPLPPPPSGPEIIVKDMAVYHRVSMVGEGTYGKVYKASNNLTKELVALKRIRMENEKDGFPITAVREMKLLQALKHENIVSLLEMMVEKSDFYMVFDYMDHDLTGILNHPTFRLELTHIKHLARQFFDALHYLHHRGVLHRDIKGSNILLNNDGQLKIADFGLARFYTKNSKKEMDYTNRIITLWYRPPEILLGATAYGPAVDMWSAACVFVELFTRVPLFPGRTEIDQLDIIYKTLGKPTEKVWPTLKQMPWYSLLRMSGLNRKNRFRRKFAEQIPPSALDLITQLLQYDPERRPTAEDCLKHPYFSEDPAPEPPLGLRDLQGDWHEYESKMERRKERDNQKKRHDADRKKAKEAKEAAKRSGQAQGQAEYEPTRPPVDSSHGIAVPVKRKIEAAVGGASDDTTGSDPKRTRSEEDVIGDEEGCTPS